MADFILFIALAYATICGLFGLLFAWEYIKPKKIKTAGQIPPVKNPLPPPPDLRNAMPRAVVLPAPERKGRYEPNDNGIIVWNVDDKSAPWVSMDFAPPLDPPTSYTSDSGSSSSDSSPTDFGGGTMGGGGAGGEY